MPKDFDRIYRMMRVQLTPDGEERSRVKKIAAELVAGLERALREVGSDVEVRLNGSVAKDTWIKGEADIDVFIRVPPRFPRSFLGEECLRLARSAVSGYRIIERYAEHPYLETWIDGVRVNIVPCYRVRPGEWRSAVDRTPYHTEYMKKNLNRKLKGDVRILKKLLKSTGLYGAEIRTKGFSGFLCEILILYYGGLKRLLLAASNWKRREVIDVEKQYVDRRDAYKIFNEPLIVIDPIDRMRNAAAAVSEKNVWTFVALAREYVKHPSSTYFFLDSVKVEIKDVEQEFASYQADVVLLDVGKIEGIVDIVWGQLYKTARTIESRLRELGFNIIRVEPWSSERGYCIILFEVESTSLRGFIEHAGPPVYMKESSESFLREHLYSEDTLTGPWIDGDRWKVIKKRKISDFSSALEGIVKDGGQSKIPTRFHERFKTGYRVYFNEDVVKFCDRNREALRPIYKFLAGKLPWLGGKKVNKSR